MTAVARRLLDQALDLPFNERARLAHELLISLDERARDDSEAWIAEVERRARAAIAGEPGIPWHEARAEIESFLADR